jgi:DNA-nicking Smr family endonuclease
MSGKKGKTSKAGATKSSATIPDIDLWERYTRGIQPARGRAQSMPSTEQPSRANFAALLDDQSSENVLRKRSPPGDASTSKTSTRDTRKQATSDPLRKPAAAPSAIDPHLLRRTKRGGGFDARIDLHGMRRDEAYHALLGFLANCHRRQLKLALVITGKGTNSKQAQDWWDMPERGVLKRLVPQWLLQPAFARLVSGYGQAGRADGGEGALYVQIRNPRRTPNFPGASP